MTASALFVDERAVEEQAPAVRAGLQKAADIVSAATCLTDDGRIAVGDEAYRLGAERPEYVVRGYVNRVGDAVDIVAGDRSIRAEGVMAAAVAALVERAAERFGCSPLQVCVTHPAYWGAYKIALLDAALRQVGIDDALLVADAAAAASGHALGELRDADTVAVFDLGGDSASAAVVRSEEGCFRVTGNAPQAAQTGGADFDHALFEHVCRGVDLRGLDRSIPGLGAAVGSLRQRCTAAKEALSVDTDAMVSVALPRFSTRIRVVRSEFEDLIRHTVQDSLEPLLEAIERSGYEPADIDAVLLVGGSSRIPLVVQTVSAELRRPIVVDHCPESTVAVGAARLAATRARSVLRHQLDARQHQLRQDELRPDEHRQDEHRHDEHRHDEHRHDEDIPGDEASLRGPGEPAEAAAAADAESPADEIEANERRRVRVSRSAKALPRLPLRRSRVRQAAATVMLAAAIFATPSAAAPHILESGGVRDGGAASGRATPVDGGSSAASGGSVGRADGAAGQHR